MRRFLTLSFLVLALVVNVAGATHAQSSCPPGQTQDAFGTCTTDANAASAQQTAQSTAANLQGGLNANGSLTPDQYAAAQQTLDAANQTPATLKGDDTDKAYNIIMIKIMQLFAWLVGVAALTLNYAAYYTIVTMGTFVKNLSAVGATWQILRDFGNIMLIFGFVAVGVTTILNVDWYGGGKKILPMMLVAAVFLNFSLFISEAFIDVSNLFATQFYTQINGGTPVPQTVSLAYIADVGNQGIAGKIMSQLGLSQVYGGVMTQNDRAKDIFAGANPWFIGFMSVILFIVLAFVLFALAFVLIARFVILLFLIILSPAAFAGLAIPMLSKRMGQWWDKLFEQVVTAPVLLLMLYLALRVITATQFLTGFCPQSTNCSLNWLGFLPGQSGNLANAIPSFGSVMLSFIVAMGLLIVVVIQSKNLSAFGASWASQTAGKLSFGLTAAGLRSTAGWGLQGASQLIRRSRIGGTKTGRLLATTFDKGATANFDIRSATAFGGLKAAGIDAGDTQKGGYRARRDATIKGHQDYIKTVNAALDEAHKPTPEEEKAVNAAQKQKEVADAALINAERSEQHAKDSVAVATGELNKAQTQYNLQKAEVDRLTAASHFGDPQIKAELEAAQNKLYDRQVDLDKVRREKETADTTLGIASRRLDDADKAVENAATVLKNIQAATGDRLKKQKEQVARQYAGNIEGSFPGWVMYGPGGSVAARKIIRDATKNSQQALLETLQKAIDTTSKPEEKKEESKPTGAKPAGTP